MHIILVDFVRFIKNNQIQKKSRIIENQKQIEGMSSSTTSLTSNFENCAYCGEHEHTRDLIELNDDLYKLLSEHRNYPRNARFCIHCVRRARVKLENRLRKRLRSHSSNQSTTTTSGTSTSTSSRSNDSSFSTAPMPHYRRIRSNISSDILDANGTLLPDIDYPRGTGG